MTEVNIPLEVQERLFAAYCWEARQQLIEILEGPCGDLMQLAMERLRAGFETYGSEMFTWTPERRRKEVMEELADAIVYLGSGSIE